MDSKSKNNDDNNNINSNSSNNDSDDEDADLINRQQVPLTKLASSPSPLVPMSRFRSNVVYTTCWLMLSTAKP